MAAAAPRRSSDEPALSASMRAARLAAVGNLPISVNVLSTQVHRQVGVDAPLLEPTRWRGVRLRTRCRRPQSLRATSLQRWAGERRGARLRPWMGVAPTTSQGNSGTLGEAVRVDGP